MTNCPKCGSGTIIGPKFISRFGREALEYRCFRCGYTTTGPTVEQEREQAEKRKPFGGGYSSILRDAG